MVERGGYFGLWQAGIGAELGYGNVGAGGLAQLVADALEQALAGVVAGAGELGNVFGIKANLGHFGAGWSILDKRRYNG